MVLWTEQSGLWLKKVWVDVSPFLSHFGRGRFLIRSSNSSPLKTSSAEYTDSREANLEKIRKIITRRSSLRLLSLLVMAPVSFAEQSLTPPTPWPPSSRRAPEHRWANCTKATVDFLDFGKHLEPVFS